MTNKKSFMNIYIPIIFAMFQNGEIINTGISLACSTVFNIIIKLNLSAPILIHYTVF